MDAPSNKLIVKLLNMCSTPFGDIDGCTRLMMPSMISLVVCSTPFGDIDGCTFNRDVEPQTVGLCSTPFGDIDGCTLRKLAVRVLALHVLNAFRRH